MKKRLLAAVALAGLAGGGVRAHELNTNVVVLARDGAWTWYNDPRALFHQDKLFFGYVRAGNAKTVLSVFDLATGETADLWNSEFSQLDDHNVPGLCAKADGTLLAVYARHGSDQYFAYRTSTGPDPVTAADWSAEQRISNSGASMTYANPFQLAGEAGKIYNFCRNLNYNPTVYTSTDGGANWSMPQWFIRTGSGPVRPYVKYSSDGVGRIDFLYTDGHPRDVANSLYHLYYQAGAFYRTDDSLVKNYADLPILHDSGERGTVIYQYSAAAQADPDQWIPAGRAWCWEIAADSNGAPACVFTVQRDGASWSDDRIFYYYARWTGTAWQKRFIAHAGRPLYSAEDDYAGGICVDPQDPRVVYLSSNARDPFDLADTVNVPLNANQRYELYRGVTADGGLTFAWTPLTGNSAHDNLRPYVPRRYGGESCVLWFRGSYSSYTSYACAIVGLFTTAVPVPPPPPPITYVDATSGPAGNTQAWDANAQAWVAWSPPANGTYGVDNQWELETFANQGTWFESNREGTEDAPQLRTRVTGLVPGVYDVYAYFWRAAGQGMTLGAALTNNPSGGLPLYRFDSVAVTAADPFGFSPANVLVTEADRTMYQIHLGAVTGTSVVVYIDDEAYGGYQSSVWYDGIGYQARIQAPEPPPLSGVFRDGFLTLTWPEAYTGWILENNPYSLALPSGWTPVPGSTATNSFGLLPNPWDVRGFFRLRGEVSG